MLTPVIKSVVHTETITKEVVYPTGVICEYTLVNGNLNNYSFTSSLGKKLNQFIPPELLKCYVNVPWHNTHQHFKSVYVDDLFESEEQLLNFKGTSNFYQREETTLYDLENKVVPLAISLGITHSFHYWIHNNDQETMQLFIDFVSGLDGVQVLEKLSIKPIPYYNCDSYKDHEQYCVYDGLVKVCPELYSKMLRPSSYGDTYLCSSQLVKTFCELFLEKHPKYKYKE